MESGVGRGSGYSGVSPSKMDKKNLAGVQVFDTVPLLSAATVVCAVAHREGCAGKHHAQMKLGSEFRGFGQYMAVGIQMIVTTSVIADIGWWLDRRTGREPLFLTIFFLLGALGGIAVVWRAVYQCGGKDGK
jgi:F0F1-type ATP synthase assembly protein I